MLVSQLLIIVLLADFSFRGINASLGHLDQVLRIGYHALLNWLNCLHDIVVAFLPVSNLITIK